MEEGCDRETRPNTFKERVKGSYLSRLKYLVIPPHIPATRKQFFGDIFGPVHNL